MRGAHIGDVLLKKTVLKKSDKILLAALAVVMAVSVFVIIYFIVIGLGGGKRPAESTGGHTETEHTTEGQPGSSTEDTRPPQTPDKVIALTFDDGPSLSVTPKILDLLEKYDAKATFFTVGYNLTSSKTELLRRAISMGCEIGNHSADHPSSLKNLSDEEILRQITEVNEKLSELCGTTPTLMRPPSGSINRHILEVLYEGGVRMYPILWNADSRDWEFNKRYLDGEISREEAIEGAVELVLSEASDGGIILMHDIKEITPDVLERVLEELSAEGYTFVTVSELFDFESMGEDAYFSKFFSSYNVVPVE